MAIILCVEDEPDIRRDIVEELQGAGYVTVEAANGKEGLLCDITMPKMDGYQLLAELWQDHPTMAVCHAGPLASRWARVGVALSGEYRVCKFHHN